MQNVVAEMPRDVYKVSPSWWSELYVRSHIAYQASAVYGLLIRLGVVSCYVMSESGFCSGSSTIGVKVSSNIKVQLINQVQK